MIKVSTEHNKPIYSMQTSFIPIYLSRSEDEQFNDEKAYLIKQIKELKPLPDDQPEKS